MEFKDILANFSTEEIKTLALLHDRSKNNEVTYFDGNDPSHRSLYSKELVRVGQHGLSGAMMLTGFESTDLAMRCSVLVKC
jgi:hypothetical protein